MSLIKHEFKKISNGKLHHTEVQIKCTCLCCTVIEFLSIPHMNHHQCKFLLSTCVNTKLRPLSSSGIFITPIGPPHLITFYDSNPKLTLSLKETKQDGPSHMITTSKPRPCVTLIWTGLFCFDR
jgi:hypothetical protein